MILKYSIWYVINLLSTWHRQIITWLFIVLLIFIYHLEIENDFDTNVEHSYIHSLNLSAISPTWTQIKPLKTSRPLLHRWKSYIHLAWNNFWNSLQKWEVSNKQNFSWSTHTWAISKMIRLCETSSADPTRHAILVKQAINWP